MLSYRRKYATVVLIVLVGFVLMFLIKISVVLNSQTTTATVSKDNHVMNDELGGTITGNHVPRKEDGVVDAGGNFITAINNTNPNVYQSHEFGEADQTTNSTRFTSDALFRNSQKWLDGPRLGNIQESRMTQHFVERLIFGARSFFLALNESVPLLDISICPSDSIFVNWQPSEEPTKFIATMAKRLMYLAIHEHQHMPARAEATARRLMMEKSHVNINQTTLFQNRTVGPFDFECDPATKYIVTSIPSRRGFGINFRAFGVEPIMIGIMMNRVTLYMNELQIGPSSLRGKFFYSDCPRRDMQCMFMPLSPCVLTHEDIANAVELPSYDLKAFRETGSLDEKYKDAKVLVVQTDNFRVVPKGFENSIMEKIISLFNIAGLDTPSGIEHVENITLDPFFLEEVKRYIINPQNVWSLWEPATLYGMRPNEFLGGELDRILAKIIPQDFNGNSAIGIPIRDGDKCARESQCMSFDMYIQLAKEMATKRTSQRQREQLAANTTSITEAVMYDTILVSSDTKSITDQRFKYVTNSSFPFRIIANDEDIGQGHGKPARYSDKNAVMISSMVALKTHLLPETLVFNSCSNFHVLIVSLYRACGKAEVGYTESLLENDNSTYRLKCAWTKR